MTLDQQVCSLEIAKRLKDLGVKQESCFEWVVGGRLTGLEINELRPTHEKRIVGPDTAYTQYPAYTVAELGTILPITVTDTPIPEDANPWEYEKTTLWIRCRQGDKYNKPAGQLGEPGQRLYTNFEADTEANCRGKMLIHLLESGIIKASEL